MPRKPAITNEKAVYEVRRYVAACITARERPKFGSLASDLRISYGQLRRAFLKATGKIPTQFADRQCLQAARRLLQRTDRKIQAVADESGFGGRATIYRQFRKKTGRTPKSFRKSKSRRSEKNETKKSE